MDILDVGCWMFSLNWLIFGFSIIWTILIVYSSGYFLAHCFFSVFSFKEDRNVLLSAICHLLISGCCYSWDLWHRFGAGKEGHLSEVTWPPVLWVDIDKLLSDFPIYRWIRYIIRVRVHVHCTTLHEWSLCFCGNMCSRFLRSYVMIWIYYTNSLCICGGCFSRIWLISNQLSKMNYKHRRAPDLPKTLF